MILRDIFQGKGAASRINDVSFVIEKVEKLVNSIPKSSIIRTIKKITAAAPEDTLLSLDIPALQINDYDVVFVKTGEVSGTQYDKDAITVTYKIFRPLDEVNGSVSFTFSYTVALRDLVDINVQTKIQLKWNGENRPVFFYWLDHNTEPKKIWKMLLQKTETLLKSAIIDEQRGVK